MVVNCWQRDDKSYGGRHFQGDGRQKFFDEGADKRNEYAVFHSGDQYFEDDGDEKVYDGKKICAKEHFHDGEVYNDGDGEYYDGDGHSHEDRNHYDGSDGEFHGVDEDFYDDEEQNFHSDGRPYDGYFDDGGQQYNDDDEDDKHFYDDEEQTFHSDGRPYDGYFHDGGQQNFDDGENKMYDGDENGNPSFHEDDFSQQSDSRFSDHSNDDGRHFSDDFISDQESYNGFMDFVDELF